MWLPLQVRSPLGEPWWNKTGDVYVTKANPKPWISEMYGYAFGTANAGKLLRELHYEEKTAIAYL